MVDIVIGYMRIQVGRLDALCIVACQTLAVVLGGHWVLRDFHVIVERLLLLLFKLIGKWIELSDK